MSISVHNPDQYMSALRTIIAQGRKRIGFLIGAGGPAGMKNSEGNYPLIPAIAGLTDQVLLALDSKYEAQIAALKAELHQHDIETILSRVRSLSQVIGGSTLHGFNGEQYAQMGRDICDEIRKLVDVNLPESGSAYESLVRWIVGTARDHAVEVFTTNYDLLLEEALERAKAPYFDGFSGSRQAFFDPTTVARNDLPPRWTRLWKLHGSIGWSSDKHGDVIRCGTRDVSHLIFPEHLKYEQTQKAPYSALFDRLRSFLETPDSLLISIGFSFADAHVSARIGEGLAGNPSVSVFAFQFQKMTDEKFAVEIAGRHPNFSVYARDKAIVNGSEGDWKVPPVLPAKDWGPIRASYWKDGEGDAGGEFLLGAIEDFASFFAASRSMQAYPTLESVEAAK